MIWMDAISVDQDSKHELGHQLRLMPEIYARASRVVIYIGEGKDDSGLVLDYLNGDSSILFRENLDLDTGAALRSILTRRYFSRVWILQEVALARQAVLICGSTTIPWSCLTLENPKGRQMLDPTNIKKLTDSSPLPPVIHFDAPRYNDSDHLPALLDAAMPCKASDPRDKVFALIGLIVGAQAEGLMADYTLALHRVYSKIAAYIARRIGCVAVISRVSLTSGLPGLPSWVPDWTSAGAFQSGVAISEDPKPVSIDELQGVLMVYGIEIDKLSALDSRCWGTAKGFEVSVEGCVQPGDALYQICNTSKSDELYRATDPHCFTYSLFRDNFYGLRNTSLGYTFVFRKDSENHFKITGRCLALVNDSGFTSNRWKKWVKDWTVKEIKII